MGVCRASYQGAAQGFKLCHPEGSFSINVQYICEPVIESNDLILGRTDEGEVKGVEEEHHILAGIVREADLQERMYLQKCRAPEEI